VTEPLRFEFTVGCGADEAFDTWTRRISTWWPVQHTRSRDRSTRVVVEPSVGGRIFERTPTGEELQWGSVTTWEPPERFGYRWHITSSPDEATEVEVRFTDIGNGTTVVTIEHRGFDKLGDKGPGRREGNERYWNNLIPRFAEACAGPLAQA
jgi:Activator of Hsp90 ATPase homolog 1-like protein